MRVATVHRLQNLHQHVTGAAAAVQSARALPQGTSFQLSASAMHVLDVSSVSLLLMLGHRSLMAMGVATQAATHLSLLLSASCAASPAAYTSLET